MQHLENILEKMYREIENKESFLPLVVSNSIICYKLAHDDEVYWMNFSKKSCHVKLESLKDIYMFFIDFLPQTSEYNKSYTKKVEHLKKFDTFLQELYYKQKFYYKNLAIFKKHLAASITGIPNPQVEKFCEETFKIASQIRFS